MDILAPLQTTSSQPGCITEHPFDDYLQIYIESFEQVQYRKGEVLFREGHTAWGAYYIKSGKVKLYKAGSDGKEQILKIAHSGEFLGYSSILHQARYSHASAMLEESVLHFIPRQDFLSLFSTHSAVAEYFTQLLCQELMEAEQRITAIAYSPLRGRLAEALLALDKIYEQADENEESFILLSRQDLASLLGTAKETIIRILSEFREERLITTDGCKISVLNPKGLMRISHQYQ